MRAIFIIVIIIILGLLITPLWFGIKAEGEYNRLIESFSKHKNLEIISKEYERGWLKSSAKIEYYVKNENKNHIKIDQEDMIYHGPVPLGLISKGKFMLKPVMAVIETKANVETDSKEHYAEFINSLPSVEFQTTLSMNGDGSTEVFIPEVNEKTESGTDLNSSGLDGLINFSPDLSTVSSVFNLPSAQIEDDKALVSVKGLDMESNLYYPSANYKNPLGNLSVKIDELSSEGKEGDGPNKVTLNNFNIIASTNQKGNLLSHTHSIGFEEIIVGGNSYGPGIYELEIRNIDKEAIIDIQTIVAESQNDEGVYETDVISAEIMKLLPQIIKYSPEIEITKLSIKTNDGEITGHAIISASGDSMDNPEIAANPIFLLAAISADLNLTVSKELLDNLLKDYKIEELTDEIAGNNKPLPSAEELQTLANERAQSEIDEMLDQGLLILKDGKYEISASYSLGQITLNGNPLDLGAIMNQL